MDQQIETMLKAPLSREFVKTRSQAGRQLSYIEGWHAIDEANRIFGFNGWTRETISCDCVFQGQRNGKETVTYIAKVRITALGVVREGTGAGHGYGSTVGDCHESAIKEAETDATKRALMTFGNPFGLALYDKEQKEVADVPTGSAATQGIQDAWADAVKDRLPKGASKDQIAEAFADQIRTDLQAYKSLRGLDGGWAKRRAYIDRFEQSRPDLYEDLLDVYAQQKAILEEAA